MSAIHAAALEYAAHGWPVFPLRGKLPALSKDAGGKGFYDATTDQAVVEKMWRRFPNANIGVRTGAASGLAVVDVDPRHGGDESLSRLEVGRGLQRSAVVQVTGSGGLHLLYRYQPGLAIGARVWGPGLDLRAEGGYIVAAPSIHPITRQPYRWQGNPWNVDLPPWPDQLTPIAQPAVQTSRRPGVVPHPGRRLAAVVQFVMDAPEGQRNQRLFWAACRGADMAADGVPEAAVSEALLLAADAVGLPAAEAAATVRSGMRRQVAA